MVNYSIGNHTTIWALTHYCGHVVGVLGWRLMLLLDAGYIQLRTPLPPLGLITGLAVVHFLANTEKSWNTRLTKRQAGWLFGTQVRLYQCKAVGILMETCITQQEGLERV